MPVDRPTFSETWYRVADLRPRLRSAVQISRQHYRGQRWHVLQDPSSNDFYRLGESLYLFVGLLDGRRSIAEVWRICNEQLGDAAPTQGEVIQLLGQLYTSNLLYGEMPPDAEGLFERYRKRKRREIQGFLTNLLFVRIPLIDPDRFLNRWVGIIGRVFTVYGLAFWLALMGVGLYFAVINWGELTSQAEQLITRDELTKNAVPLAICIIIMKVLHEFGHGFACKRFGQLGGTGGEVHVMGVMFLVFMPLPYVDASAVWAFGRSKWHRVVVGAAGMIVELAVAAIATIVWANTQPGTAVHAVCYNLMFLASVTTVLFNGNPLLRFDAYFILSDMLEIANLSNRSKEYIYYLVKRYAWGVRQARSPANTPGEKRWFVFYGIASTIYRVFICVRILLFIADKLFFFGAILAVAAVGAWVLTPLYKFARYLATSGELSRVRARAVTSTVATVAAILVFVGLVPMPDRHRVEGVAEPARLEFVHAEEDGYIREFRPTQQEVSAGDRLITAENYALECEFNELLAKLEAERLRREVAVSRRDAASERAVVRRIEALEERKRMLADRVAALTRKAPLAGTWVAPDIDRMKDVYVRRGDKLGMIASVDEMIIRAVATQEFPTELAAVGAEVEVRLEGRPDLQFKAKVKKTLPAGQTRLPSRALGYAAGGSVRTAIDDDRGTKAAERFFEIHLEPSPQADGEAGVRLMSGQRVMARFSMPARPLMAQWWQSLQRLVLERFHR